jgi:hypothetical protein
MNRLLVVTSIVASIATSSAGLITTITTQHATVDAQGVVADGDVARFATRTNAYSYLNASYLVIDFKLQPSDFGLTRVDNVSGLTLSLTHKGPHYTIGRFDVFYVENSSPSIATGSTALTYNGVYGHGFDRVNPPPELSGLMEVASGVTYEHFGGQAVSLATAGIAASLIGKMNSSETIRLLISEGYDTTVSAWHGLSSDSTLAPRLTINATGIPEPSSVLLMGVAILIYVGHRRR